MIVALWASEKCWKTTMALTWPKPIVHFDLDVGGYDRAAWRIDTNNITSRAYPTPVQLEKMLGQTKEGIKIRFPKKLFGIKEVWQQVVIDFVEAVKNPELQTIVIDSATQLWSLCHRGRLQELQEMQFAKNPTMDENDLRERLQPIEYCLHPDTKVLTTNYTWERIADLSIGDTLIGFDEEARHIGKGSQRLFTTAIIEDVSCSKMPAYLIALSSEDYIIASGNHRWLVRTKFDFPSGSFHRSYWKQTEHLVPGDTLHYLGKPWSYDASRDAGYLAGVYDGESYLRNEGLGFRQNTGEVLDTTKAILQDKGYHYHEYSGEYKSGKGWSEIYLGKFYEVMKFLGSVRPQRLLPKPYWKNRAVRQIGDITVTAVIPIGSMDMIDIQTSTGTFIAEGILTHNSEPNDRMRSLIYTARSFKKHLVLTHYPRDVYAEKVTDRGIQEYKTGEIEPDGFKDTQKLVDIVIWIEADKITNDIYAKITKCGLEGIGTTGVGLAIDPSYDGILELQKSMQGS